MLKAMGFPSRYVQGPDALKQAGTLLNEFGFKRPALLCDETVRQLALPGLVDSLKAAGLKPGVVDFPGEINQGTMAECNSKVAGQNPDVVVGLGGGKSIDAAKAAAAHCGTPVVIAPTVASNDAPTSRLIVVNDEHNRPVQIDFLKLNPIAVLVDTKILVSAPPRYFAAGIGDAISKSLEAHQCANSGGTNFFGTPPLSTAVMLADQCFDTILKHARGAYDAVCKREITPQVEQLVEATVLLSGLGFESGGLSLAHSLIRGITEIPSMSRNLHGEMVAFGALVQAVVEDRPQQELDQLTAVLAHTRLPMTFADLGYKGDMTAEGLHRMVKATLAHSYAANMSPALTESQLYHGLISTNDLGVSIKGESTSARDQSPTIATQADLPVRATKEDT